MNDDNKKEFAPTADEDKEKVADISERLSNNPPEKKKEREDEPNPVESISFDINKLQPEQLQQLKAMLAVTPDRLSRKKANARTFLRNINGGFVTATKPAYLALVYDATRLSEVETHKIPVKLHNSDKWTDIIYTDFMKADRVPCEILSIREERGRRVEGEVVQRESGRLVEMEVTTVNYFFKVKLPTGEEVEIEGSASNV